MAKSSTLTIQSFYAASLNPNASALGACAGMLRTIGTCEFTEDPEKGSALYAALLVPFYNYNEKAITSALGKSKVVDLCRDELKKRTRAYGSKMTVMVKAALNYWSGIDRQISAFSPTEAIERYCEDLQQAAVDGEPRTCLTIEALREEMSELGCTVALNSITGEFVTTMNGCEDCNLDYLTSFLISNLVGRYSMVTSTIDRYLSFIAKDNEFNPVDDFFKTLKWDQKDRLEELADIIGISKDDSLSFNLLHKWLFQCVALVRNNPKSPIAAEGVLVFTGVQGAGKTSFFRKLSINPNEWFCEGATINTNDKDTTRRAITHWITELGELGSTFRKADLDMLKSFITQPRDEYRLPYARSDQRRPRRSSFAATCNDTQFLRDETGNRRWFTIPFTNAHAYEQIEAFDAKQLWAQIVEEYDCVLECGVPEVSRSFRLTPSEREELDRRNSHHMVYIKGEHEVRDVLAKAEKLNWKNSWVTITAWKEMNLIGDTLKRFSSSELGRVMQKLGIQSKKPKNSMHYYLPVPPQNINL